jgi:hypothetical protein
VVRIVAQLAAQPGDVHVQRLGGRPPLRVPDLAHDLLAGDDLPRVPQQDPQQVEFLGGEVELGVAVPGATRLGVHPDAADRGGRRLGGAAPEQGPDPGEELGQPEGLGDVVIGARVEADDGVHLVGAGGEDQHGNGVPFGPDPPAHLEPVELGQADVQQDEVGPVRQRAVEGGRPVLRDLHLVALPAQRAGQRLGDGGVVLGEQHSGHI